MWFMADADKTDNQPPKLHVKENGDIETGSLADLLDWFLMYDERTARMRHANTEELFQWKQIDVEQGISVFPFENAEARFAVGAFKALDENNSEPLLQLWISDLLEALQRSRTTKTEMTDAYKLDDDLEAFSLQKSEKLISDKLLARSALHCGSKVFRLGVSGKIWPAFRLVIW